MQIFAEKIGNLKKLCFFSVNSSNFAGFLDKKIAKFWILQNWGGKKKKKKPGLGASDFVGANFRQIVKNILSKDYSAANSVPFQIMGRKTIKIFAKIWRNCLEHERARLRIFCVHVFNMFGHLSKITKLGGKKKKELKKFVDEKSFV